ESSTRTETTGFASSVSPAKVLLSMAPAGAMASAPAATTPAATLAANFFIFILSKYRGDAAKQCFQRPTVKDREPRIRDENGAAHADPEAEPLRCQPIRREHVDAVDRERHATQWCEPTDPPLQQAAQRADPHRRPDASDDVAQATGVAADVEKLGQHGVPAKREIHGEQHQPNHEAKNEAW